MTILSYAAFLVFPAFMAYAAFSDLLSMTISNRISLILLAAFLVLAPAAGMGWQAVGLHLAMGGIVLALAFACFAFGWIGGGDAKLAAVIAMWFGPQLVFEFMVLSAIFGGMLTLALLRFRGAIIPAIEMLPDWVRRLHAPREGVPYGVALAAAALMIYPHSKWLVLVA